MTSPFERMSDQRVIPQGNTAVDLLSRGVQDLGGISFVSLDSPVSEHEVIAQVIVQDDEKLKADAAADLVRLSVDKARSEALEEARRAYDLELETKLMEERARSEQIRVEFSRDRQRFFAAAESQVVKLALAIARKVLQREASTDGLYLRSTVKAALARVQDGTVTILRVSEVDCAGWTQTFSQGAVERVHVKIDEALKPGECILETSVGVVEFGLEVQLQEVQHGFEELTQDQRY